MSIQVLTDFVYELEHAAAVAAIVSTRIFYRNPVEAPSAAYLVYTKNSSRNMVAETYTFQIIAFAPEMDDLETLTNAIIEHFEDLRYMGASGNHYYSISLLSVVDGRTKLDSGHYWNTLSFQVSVNT